MGTVWPFLANKGGEEGAKHPFCDCRNFKQSIYTGTLTLTYKLLMHLATNSTLGLNQQIYNNISFSLSHSDQMKNKTLICTLYDNYIETLPIFFLIVTSLYHLNQNSANTFWGLIH